MKTVNKIFKHTFLCMALGATVCSCDLDVEPTSSIATETFWTSEKDAWYNLNAVYSASIPVRQSIAIPIRMTLTVSMPGNQAVPSTCKTV